MVGERTAVGGAPVVQWLAGGCTYKAKRLPFHTFCSELHWIAMFCTAPSAVKLARMVHVCGQSGLGLHRQGGLAVIGDCSAGPLLEGGWCWSMEQLARY